MLVAYIVRLLRGPLVGESGGETNRYLDSLSHSLPEVDECTPMGRPFDHAVLIWYRPYIRSVFLCVQGMARDETLDF